MIRVMHLITGLNTGGAERTLFSLVRHSDTGRHGHSVVSLTDKGPVAGDLDAASVPVHALGMRRGVPSLFGLVRLVRLLRQTKPDIFQCWLYHANLLGVIAGKLAGVPHIIWGVRSSNPTPKTYPLLTQWVIRIGARLSRFPDTIVVVSEAGMELHRSWGYDSTKMVVIPNGIDLSLFHPDPSARISVRRELGLSEDTFIIGLIARFHPMKDHATFFSAAQMLNRTHPGVHFLLAGPGVSLENPEVSQLVHQNGLNDYVHLLGRRDDIPRLTAALDIACLCSWSEAFPNVVAEAMACEVPCVVTHAGDTAEIVGDTGLVVSPKNPDALAQAWTEMINMGTAKREALGKRAKRRVEEKFRMEKFIRNYETLYEGILRHSDDIRPVAMLSK